MYLKSSLPQKFLFKYISRFLFFVFIEAGVIQLLPFKSTGSPENTFINSCLPPPIWCLLKGHTTTLETKQTSKPQESLEVIILTSLLESLGRLWPVQMAWHCGCMFTIGAHDNPLSRHGKPHFPAEDTEVQGREVAGLGLTSTENQHLRPQERPGHIEDSWWSRRVLGLEYVYFPLSAVWVGCYSWWTGPMSTRNTWSRKPRWMRTWRQAYSTSRVLWVNCGNLLRSPTRNSVGTGWTQLGQTTIRAGGLRSWPSSP